MCVCVCSVPYTSFIVVFQHSFHSLNSTFELLLQLQIVSYCIIDDLMLCIHIANPMSFEYDQYNEDEDEYVDGDTLSSTQPQYEQ